MGDFFGISRTIDHAVYTLLNSIAVILWRLDAAIIQGSMFGYATEDWLMGRQDGDGIWALLDKMVGPGGIFGLSTWQAFIALALTMYGFSLLIRPFWRMQPVDLGRMFFFAVLSYSLISEGSGFMREIETWRGQAGGYMYEIVAGSGGPINLEVPGGGTSDEPIYAPADLDGRAPIRGWEAVATSYFLVKNATGLHQGVPAEDFRREYCLYDPGEAIGEQDQENSAGCSPKKAWDEWQEIELTAPITQVWGIPLPIDVSVDMPVFQEHPENRQLAIRQAQEGVARLALGPLVAAWPMIEANVGLMLALSAAFIYLSLPITLLFGLFRYTEPLVNRLVMQLIGILIRTFILNGLLAVFLMLLMSVSINGSLMAYLGLIAVGLIGGFFLTKIAAGTMSETISTSLGGLTSVWVGAATGTLGEGARQPAVAAAGAVKWGAAGAMLGWAGRGALDMWSGARQVAHSGSEDLRQGAPEAMQVVDQGVWQTVGALPTPIARLARPEVKAWTAQTAGPSTLRPGGDDLGPAPGRAWGSGATYPDPIIPEWQPRPERSGLAIDEGPNTLGWAEQVYQVRRQGHGERQVIEAGQLILGERLGKQAYQAMARHSQQETLAVLQAAGAAAGQAQPLVQVDGTLAEAALRQVRGRLEGPVLETFSGRQGEADLETLVAAAWQARKRAEPDEFRTAAARAREWQGAEAAGRLVPRTLGLDPVASGADFAALNRFTRLSNQVGLDEAQRKRLLEALRYKGEVSAGLRRELETALRRRPGARLSIEDLLSSARALPETLEGPLLLRLSQADREPEAAGRGPLSGSLTGPAAEADPSDLKKVLSTQRKIKAQAAKNANRRVGSAPGFRQNRGAITDAPEAEVRRVSAAAAGPEAAPKARAVPLLKNLDQEESLIGPDLPTRRKRQPAGDRAASGGPPGSGLSTPKAERLKEKKGAADDKF